MDRAGKVGPESQWPRDAVPVRGFSVASSNHWTATGAINAAIEVGFRGPPLPFWFVCEDDGIACLLHRAAWLMRTRSGRTRRNVEIASRRQTDLAADVRRDLVVATARLLFSCGLLGPHKVLDRYEDMREGGCVSPVNADLPQSPTLPSEPPPSLAQSINRSLLDILACHSRALVFSEYVDAKGG